MLLYARCLLFVVLVFVVCCLYGMVYRLLHSFVVCCLLAVRLFVRLFVCVCLFVVRCLLLVVG